MRSCSLIVPREVLRLAQEMESPHSTDPPSTPGEEHTVSFKLFVGQLPRSFEEDDLFPIFKDFGEIQELVILRDRQSGASKGNRRLRYSILFSLHKLSTHAYLVWLV